MVLLNLPRKLRFEVKNIFLSTLFSGPKKPRDFNCLFSLLVKELRILYKGIDDIVVVVCLVLFFCWRLFLVHVTLVFVIALALCWNLFLHCILIIVVVYNITRIKTHCFLYYPTLPFPEPASGA